MERIDLRPGEERVILLPGRAGAGYRWTAEVDDREVVELQSLGADFRGGDATMDERFVLRAKAQGETTARFRQARAFSPGAPPLAEREYRVCVEEVAGSAS